MTKTEEIMELVDACADAAVRDYLSGNGEASYHCDKLKSAIEELVLAERGPSGIDPTSLGILLTHNGKTFFRVLSSSELRQFKKPKQYVADAATDLVNVFFSGDETMKEITP